MGKRCALKDCKNYDQCGTGVTFHKIPAANDMRQLWLNALPPDSLREHTKYLYICSEHFTMDSYQPPFLGLTKRMLKKTAVPSIFDCATNCLHKTMFTDNEDATVPGAFRLETDPLAIDTPNSQTMLFGLRHEVATQTDSTNTKNIEIQTDWRRLKPTDRELELRRENRLLKQRLRRRDQRITTMTRFIQQNSSNFSEEEIMCAVDNSKDVEMDLCGEDGEEEEFNIIVIE